MCEEAVSQRRRPMAKIEYLDDFDSFIQEIVELGSEPEIRNVSPQTNEGKTRSPYRRVVSNHVLR